MLKTVKITDLFTTFSYEFDLKEGGITILTGPNGFGKSTLLGLISAVASGEPYALFAVPYTELCLTFSDQNTFIVKRTPDRTEIDGVYLNGGVSAEWFRGVTLFHGGAATEIMRRIRAASDESGIAFDDPALPVKLKAVKDAFLAAAKRLGEVRFIRDQRRHESSPGADAHKIRSVTEIETRLKDRINEALYSYASCAEELDETFPERLIAFTGADDQKSYTEVCSALTALQTRLYAYHFISGPPKPGCPYNGKHAAALMLSASDRVHKLSDFVPLLDKLDTFTRLIDEKLKLKRLMLSRDGVFITDDKTGTLRLPLTALSSGEQQILVFYYQLIFESGGHSMLLIDEPEISLHIAWQLELIDDLKAILSALKSDTAIIIATHSPQVLTGNWDLQVDLGELYAD